MINLSQILPAKKRVASLNGIDKGLIEIGTKILAIGKPQPATADKEA